MQSVQERSTTQFCFAPPAARTTTIAKPQASGNHHHLHRRPSIPVDRYSAALLKLVQVTELVGSAAASDAGAIFRTRLAQNLAGLDDVFLAPAGDYFIRSQDPNGTLHGVLGQVNE